MQGIRGWRMAAFFGDLYLWFTDVWGQIIDDLFGRHAKRAQLQLTSLDDDCVRISWGKTAASEPFAPADLAARLKESGTQNSNHARACVLRLENGRALVRSISKITLPYSRLRAAALLDLESATPFRPADAHALTLYARGGGGSSYAIVKRSILDPLMEECSAAGLNIKRIDIAGGGQVHCVSAECMRHLTGSAGKPKKGWAAAIIIAVAIIGTLAHAAMNYDSAIQQVEDSAAQLGEEAKAVQIAMDQRALRIAEIVGLRKSVEERKLVNSIWEELARVLPDSSFLTDLSIKDSTISISGYSDAASSIIVALEGSDMFDQASFTAPVVKVPGSSGDRFAIDLKIGVK